MGTKIKSHLALLCFYSCYVSCCLCFFLRWKIVRMMATVLIFHSHHMSCFKLLVLIAPRVSMQSFFLFFVFSSFFFLLFPCSLSGGQMRPVSRLCRSATSAAAFPVWRGKSRDMKAECVRMMVRGKEGGGGGREKERGEREQSPTPSVPPSILAQPFQSSHPSGQLQWDLLTNCSDAVQGFL